MSIAELVCPSIALLHNFLMDADEEISIRRAEAEKLKELFESLAEETQAVFGERYGIGNQSMVWQYLNDRRPLNHAAAAAFAEGLRVPIDDFSPRLAQEIRTMNRRVVHTADEATDDEATRHGIQVLRAMRPEARYKAVRILDTLAESLPIDGDPPTDAKRKVA